MRPALAAALRNRVAIGAIAAFAIATGLWLYWPVRLDVFDPWGFRITCGSGFLPNFDRASAPLGGDDITACRNAVWSRRAWAAVPLGIGVGCLAVLHRTRRPRPDSDNASGRQ